MAVKLALLIGVSKYGEDLDNLSAPLYDVKAMQRVLANPNLGGFEVEITLDPDLLEMQEKIESLFERSSKEDLILLYFSGHGITDDNNHLYLTTRNTLKKRYRSRSVPARFIQNLSDSAYAKRQVIILDCCYSGAFSEGWQHKGEVKLDLKQELGKEGRVVLTSSSATQVSYQQNNAELSLYTQFIVEGIEQGAADTNQKGEVTVQELHRYAKQKVQAQKPKLKPDIIVADAEGYDIVLSRVKVDEIVHRVPNSFDESLVSERLGVGYYAKLRDLLAAKDWKAANYDTLRRMLEVMNRQGEYYLRDEDISNFPCQDLQNINNLWLRYSQGKFGFSVQKEIWERCGSPTSSNKKWEKFGEFVGWQKPGFLGPHWYHHYELNFDLSAPWGHLPFGTELWGSSAPYRWVRPKYGSQRGISIFMHKCL